MFLTVVDAIGESRDQTFMHVGENPRMTIRIQCRGINNTVNGKRDSST